MNAHDEFVFNKCQHGRICWSRTSACCMFWKVDTVATGNFMIRSQHERYMQAAMNCDRHRDVREEG